MRLFSFMISLIIVTSACSQKTNSVEIPYQQIPEYPANFEAGNLISRMIDGLGYRYYWATESLREEDLLYEPGNNGKSTLKTIEHLYGLSETILNTAKNIPSLRPANFTAYSYEDFRKKTLINLKEASDIFLQKQKEDLSECNVIFQRGPTKKEFPVWNLINGPITDAIYHTGQIVSFRRSSGNPINPEVNVFMGKTGK